MRARLGRNHGEEFGKLDRAEHPKHRHNAKRKAEIPDPVDDKGLDGCGTGAWLFEPEPDQEI